jgi:hypothetical protein
VVNSLEEVNATLAQLGRPKVEDFRHITNLGLMADLRRRQDIWDTQHPEGAELYRKAREVGDKLQREAEEAGRREAEDKRSLETVRRMVGDKIADLLKAPRSTPMLLEAQAWAKSDAWALVMAASPGTGKSTGASWVLKYFLAGGHRVMWLVASDMALRPMFGPEAMDRLDRAKKADLLVIDDLGSEVDSPHWRTWLGGCLSARYTNGGKTLITTNLAPDSLKARVGDMIYDRFKEGKLVSTTGTSMRGNPRLREATP